MFRTDRDYALTCLDLQSNVIIDDDGLVSLTGLGTPYSSRPVRKVLPCTAVGFMAPESLDSDDHESTKPEATPAMDVYAFGSLCFEVSTSFYRALIIANSQ